MVFEKMYFKRFTVAFLCAVMLLSALAGCAGDGVDTTATEASPTDTEQSGSASETDPIETETETEEVKGPSSKDPGYVIPDEELSGRNESAEPLEDDGNGEAIFERLRKADLIKNTDVKASDILDRSSFAYDVIYYAGFTAQQAAYICENVYSDMEAFSSNMRRAEIAVNQGFSLCSVNTHVLCQTEDGDAVDNAEVGTFCLGTLVLCNLFNRLMENLG